MTFVAVTSLVTERLSPEEALSRRASALRDDVRRELLRAASDGKTVTYGLLMRKFRISRGAPGGKGIVGVIGEIDRHEARKGAPGFAAMVVRKDTGFPGGGFFTWEGLPSGLRRPKREGSNPRLSDAERRFIKNQQEEIWSYYKGARRRVGTTDDSPK